MAKVKKKSKIKKRLTQLAALLALGGLLAWFFMPSPIAVKVDEVRVGSFSATVEAEGMTQARDRIVVWAPVAGIAQRMPLALGDPVVVQQIAARFVPDAATLQNPQTIRYLTERARAAASAKNRILAEREKAAAVVNQARDNLRNAEQLAATGGANAMQLEQARVAVKLLFKELESLDAAARSAAYDVSAAESALQKIRNEAPREWEMHAPVNGTVLAVADNGKPVAMGAPLIEIGNPMDLEAVVETSASAAAQVSAGQRVELKPARADALAGRVRRVEIIQPPASSGEVAAPSKARIAIEFTDRPSQWRKLGNNHALNARITIATIDNVLKIPASALIAGSQQTAVFVIENGRAQKRAITLSARDADTLVIESGLKESQRVILSPSPKIQDGTRVKLIY